MGEWVGSPGKRLAPRREVGKFRRMWFEGANGEIGGPRWWARAISFAAVVGLLMGVIGPFGSYLNPMPLRLLDQVVMTISGTVMAGIMIPLTLRLGRRLGLPRPFTLVVAIVVTAAPIAALSALVSTLIWPWNVAHYHASNWYFEALLMLASLFTLWVILEGAQQAWRATARPPNEAPAARPDLGAEPALCLQTEDNYVRVHRAQGSTLELMPLHEAISRFGQADGLRVHRGWWVAAAAVDGAERDARNWRLRLVNGLRAPVARNRVVDVRARGWLPEP